MDSQAVGRWIFIGVTGVVGLSLAISVFSDRFAPAGAPVKFAESADPGGVRLTVSIPEDRVEAGQLLWIYYDVYNGSGTERSIQLEPLTNANLAIQDWEEEEQGMWVSRGREYEPAVTLPEGESQRFRASVVISGGPAVQTLTTGYSFAQANGQERTRRFVSLAPVRVWSGWRSVLEGIQNLTGSLLLPFMLGVLAWFIPWASARNTEKTTQINQTWTLLLPYTLQITTKYYMPACSAILWILLEQRTLTPDRSLRPMLHNVLMFMRHMRDIRDEIGGLHFKDREGEKAASYWWRAIRIIWEQTMETSLHSRVLDHLTPRESYNQFEARFQDWKTKDDFLAIEKKFTEWHNRKAAVNGIRPFPEYLILFEMFRAVVHFEANRPLERWYPQQEDFGDVERAFNGLKDRNFEEVESWRMYVSHTKTYVEAVRKNYPAAHSV